MLSNDISVSYDALADGNLVEKPYSRYDEYQNRSVYIGAEHNPAKRDTLTFYRSFPKQVGDFKGVAKSSFKISVDETVTGVNGLSQITSPFIVEVNFSIPLGVSDAERIRVQQLAAGLIRTGSLMDSLTKQLMV